MIGDKKGRWYMYRMKRDITIVSVLVFASLLLMVASIGSVSGSDLIFEDNFESNVVGSYPSSPWYNIWSGDTAYVTDSYAYSGTKSFYSRGRSGWSRTDAVQIDPIKKIAYEVAVYATAYPTDARIGLYNKDINTWGTYYADIRFLNGKIYARGGAQDGIGEYKTNTWYHVRVEANFDTQKMDVYINDKFLGNQLEMGGTPGEALYNTFILGAEHSSGNSGVYYDGVKLLDLAPGSGPSISTTHVFPQYDWFNHDLIVGQCLMKFTGPRTIYVNTPAYYMIELEPECEGLIRIPSKILVAYDDSCGLSPGDSKVRLYGVDGWYYPFNQARGKKIAEAAVKDFASVVLPSLVPSNLFNLYINGVETNEELIPPPIFQNDEKIDLLFIAAGEDPWSSTPHPTKSQITFPLEFRQSGSETIHIWVVLVEGGMFPHSFGTYYYQFEINVI